jgi:hypothetical protein
VRSFGGSRLALILAVLSMGTCLNFVGIAVALNGVTGQAQAGQAARDRSCLIYPTSLRIFEDAHHRHVITAQQLHLFRASAEQVCQKQ